MPITTREARQLSTASEWPLIESSQPDQVRALTPARLKTKIARARTLRNKYRDLAKRQHRKVQPRRTGRPDENLNVRTARKAELFEQVLARLEKEAERQSARESSAAATRKKTSSQRAVRAGVARKASRPAATKSPSKRSASRSSQVPKSAVSKRSGQHRIHAHVSNTTRRRQARRDSRGR